MITLLEFPWDASSSYARGAALGPATIRAMLDCQASNRATATGIDALACIEESVRPLLPADAAGARQVITDTIAGLLAESRRPLSLGGDHSISFPILQAFAAQHGAMNVLHIDAHPDLYPELDGDPYSHACPFARALEQGLIAKLVQVGIRSVTAEQLELGNRHGVTMLGPEQWHETPQSFLDSPLYISIDLDGLDPAFAPGVSHPEPGGLSSLDLFTLLGRINGPVLGADVVEFNPEFDQRLLTARIAARLVKELAALMSRE